MFLNARLIGWGLFLLGTYLASPTWATPTDLGEVPSSDERALCEEMMVIESFMVAGNGEYDLFDTLFDMLDVMPPLSFGDSRYISDFDSWYSRMVTNRWTQKATRKDPDNWPRRTALNLARAIVTDSAERAIYIKWMEMAEVNGASVRTTWSRRCGFVIPETPTP